MPKQRVNLYLDSDLYARFQAVVAEIPSVSLSSVVNQWMAAGVPALEQLLAALKAGEPERAMQGLHEFVGDLTGEAFVGMRTLREEVTRKGKSA